MDTIAARKEMASFLATLDAGTLSQVLLELAEDFVPVYERLERLRERDDPAVISARFSQRLQGWAGDDRFVSHRDAAALGQELFTWVAQVEREVVGRFPCHAMTLLEAFLDLDRPLFERVDDDGGCIGGAFELACQLWLKAAAATGLSRTDIADRVSAILAADDYGARAELARAGAV